MQIWTSRGEEQGYQWRQYGQTDRYLKDHDGIALLTFVHKRGKKKGKKGEPKSIDSLPEAGNEHPAVAIDDKKAGENL